jgi:hypothetical protein
MDAPYTAYTTWEDKCYRTPMDLNNVKILIGSVTETISRKIILGDEAYSKALLLLNTLVYSIEYAMKQLGAGHLEYEAKVRTLKQSLVKLQYECDSICTYKEQYKFVAQNRPPTIEGNSITLPYTQPAVITETPPTCSVLPSYRGFYPYGEERVFTKANFTLDPTVDKMIIKQVDILGSLGSYVKFKRVSLLGSVDIEVSFDEIDQLANKIYRAPIVDQGSGQYTGTSGLGMQYILCNSETGLCSSVLCTMGGIYTTSLYE